MKSYKKDLGRKMLLIFLCVVLIILQLSAQQGIFVAAASEGTCTANVLNIRSGPGTKYEQILVNGKGAFLTKNQKVSVFEQKDGWYQLQTVFDGEQVEGYCLKTYIKLSTPLVQETNQTEETKTEETKTEETKTEETKAEETKAEETKAEETKEEETKEEETILADDAKQEMRESFVLSAPAVITANELNIRQKADKTSKLLGTVKKNTSVTILGRKKNGNDDWYQISVVINKKTIKGYVLAQYVKCSFNNGFYGKISADGVVLKSKAASNAPNVIVNGQKVLMKKETLIWLSQEVTISGIKYFKVSFTYQKKKVYGYLQAKQLELLGKKVITKVPVTNTPTPSITEQPVITPETKPNALQEPVAFSIPAKVTANTLNLRKGASTSSAKLGTLTNNTPLTVKSIVKSAEDRWYYVTVSVNDNLINGYVHSDYVAFTFEKGFYGVVLADEIKMQTEPGVGKDAILLGDGSEAVLKKWTSIWLSEEQTIQGEKWFRIGLTLQGKATRGYTKASEIEITWKKYTGGSQVVEGGATQEPTKEPTGTPSPTAHPLTPTPSPTAHPLTPTPSPTAHPLTPTPSVFPYSAKGIIQNASSLVVKAAAGYASDFTKDSAGNVVLLASGKEVTIYGSAKADGLTWFNISFDYGGVVYTGYVNEGYVKVDETTIIQGDATIPETVPGANSSDFETKLFAQGFPESYKNALRLLHQQYPNWEFVAYHTGLDWNTVIDNESISDKSLISNSKGIGWKSIETDAYNWKTDRFIVYDGSYWVKASKAAISYYMDPRNFLNDNGIFQFEHLAYQFSYQNLSGVENILKNTPMYQSSFSYTEDSGNIKSITYSSAFMDAAEYSGVSPYHLASRVKQEVVVGSSAFSNSASGNFSGFEGLYNFYNIGAYHSTVAGGAIANGLKYAKNGSTNAQLNVLSLIPWVNPYRAIVGGAAIIGSSYINRGQDTIYLQKFNVTPTSTYAHQYMANIEAPYSESKKVFTAYTDVSTSPIVFSIPIFLNMPEQACTVPEDGLNPNNWLKTLRVTDLSGNDLMLTPSFDISANQEYYLTLGSEYEVVSIDAACVSSKAVVFGTGAVALQTGQNIVTVSVTAQNGTIREYRIIIVREG